jgi:hypothetical protein
MRKGLPVRPNKWSQFSDRELMNLIVKHYPRMTNLLGLPRYTLIEILEHRERRAEPHHK